MSKVLFKKGCSEKFYECQIRFLIKQFKDENLFLKKYFITTIFLFLEQLRQLKISTNTIFVKPFSSHPFY